MTCRRRRSSRTWCRGQRTVLVRGSVTDNGEIKRVVVNGTEAELDAASGQWVISLLRSDNSPLEIIAHSEDAAGNVEQLVHKIKL